MALALVSTLFLVFGIASCASHGGDLVVLTTADRLREEIRSQLDEALEDSLPELCTGPPQNYGSPAQPPHLMDAIKEAVNETVSDILAPLISNSDIDTIKEAIKEAVNETVSDVLAPLMSQLFHLITPGYTSHLPASS